MRITKHRATAALATSMATLLVLALTACSSAKHATTPTTTTVPAPAPGVADAAGTVWLCRPGLADNPCLTPRTATVVGADGSRTVQQAAPATAKADCFYVYPTVSAQKTSIADLTIDPEERSVAVQQASRFSQVCNVWAPMYRQRTISALFGGRFADAQDNATTYASLLSAWRDYLAHDNHGRPIIFIGHSQGSAILIKLLHDQVDPSASLRARLVSAVLLGGNVQVPVGARVGGSFAHIPTCTSDTENGCVIAYSTFPGQPPAAALFGRAGQGVSTQSGQTSRTEQVVCVDPTRLGGHASPADSYFAGTTGTTTWLEYPGRYDVGCHTADGASWLNVQPAGGAADTRPTVGESLGPTWGYHLFDVNLLLGNLVDVVGHQAAAHR